MRCLRAERTQSRFGKNARKILAGIIAKIPEEELILKGVISFIEKEIRLAEGEIADLREKYDVPKKAELYEGLEQRMWKVTPPGKIILLGRIKKDTLRS